MEQDVEQPELIEEKHKTILRVENLSKTVSADRFSFRHALTHQAIYAGLLARERRALHSRVASAIEQLFLGCGNRISFPNSEAVRS
jgi:predicted ATPase